MREILLFLTLAIGQLAPNSGLYSQIQERLRANEGTTGSKTAVSLPDPIIVSPIKKDATLYTTGSQAIYSIDLASNEILSSKDQDKKLPVASLTKLMTAYVILKDEPNLGRVMTVPTLSTQLGDALMGINTGEQLTVENLLRGLLINSGSDAAETLAVGDAGSQSAFVAKMNESAAKLSLANTHFANPVGWDDAENYSSAHDLVELARILLRNKTFAETVTTKNISVTTEAGRVLNLTSTNELLGKPGYIGVKTGFTYSAGECLISLYHDGDKKILTAVIGSGSRFTETETIKTWILDHFSW